MQKGTTKQFSHIVFSSILYDEIGNQNFLNDKSATSPNETFNQVGVWNDWKELTVN